jgi:hypothetical protein
MDRDPLGEVGIQFHGASLLRFIEGVWSKNFRRLQPDKVYVPPGEESIGPNFDRGQREK